MDFENELEQNGEIENGIPKYTQWEHRFSIFGLHFYYVPSISKTFINHWEVNLCMPILVNIIIWSSYSLFLISYIRSLNWSMTSLIIMTIFFSFYVLSYFNIILEGPGYLPFFYPHQPPQTGRKYPDYLSGIVTNKVQNEFVKHRFTSQIIVHPHVHFFRSARRVVIRPDHFCDWCACFIGKKNYKLFFLFNFWGVLYIGFFGISCVMGFAGESKKPKPNVFLLIFEMIYVFLAFFFFIFQIIFVGQGFYSIFSGTREFENMRNEKIKEAGVPLLDHKEEEEDEICSCLGNVEEVFGSAKCCFLWPLPIGAFHGVDDYLLVSESENNENDWYF